MVAKILTDIVVARREDDLEHVIDRIHDERFSIEYLTFKQTKRTLCVFFEKQDRTGLRARWYHLLFHRWSVPVFQYVLEIQHVDAYTLQDDAKIVSYTFNTIDYDPNSGRLEIIACEDLRIIVETSELLVSVLATGKNLGVRRFLTVLGCEIEKG